MVDEFDLNKRTGIDLPNEVMSTTPSREFKAKLHPKGSRMERHRHRLFIVRTGLGVITPIALLRAHSADRHEGEDVRAASAERSADRLPRSATIQHNRIIAPRAGHVFDRPQPKDLGIPIDQSDVVVQAMWAVVNAGGTATGIKIGWFRHRRQNGNGPGRRPRQRRQRTQDHSWFVTYAPAYKPEIAFVALIENAGLGSRFGAPAVRAVYDVYYNENAGSPKRRRKPTSR